MNQLQHETSPYLLQHAHNPVQWYAWKEEAFRRAVEENKPILVSIGYSTCHWCHVMERESFEDESVADFMNAHFINIKVDREERPDVDQIYMEACQAISGSGGWPLNAFLTPDKRPFFAGTYYPPTQAHGRPSWMQVLRRMAQVFKTQREVVEEQADKLMEVIQNSNRVFTGNKVAEGLGAETPEDITGKVNDRLFAILDKQDGGFGAAPKFPGIMSLRYLMDFSVLSGQEEGMQWVHFSVEKMIRGGIYDQLGGGLARYATDKAWLIPHFEKMLYDNALLLGLLADLYRIRPVREYEETILQTIAFLEREMAIQGGGFAAALDADSEGVEGKFYVWEAEELSDLLGDEFPGFSSYYSVQEGGNWEGKSILWRATDDAIFCQEHGVDQQTLDQKKERWRQMLWPEREQRVRPGLDHKLLLSWNALMATALAKVAKAFPAQELKQKAINHLDFILDSFQDKEGVFYHTYSDGQLQYPAFLEDYAFLIEALLEVYELDFDLKRIRQAGDLTEHVLREFLDEDGNFFYFSSEGQKDVPLRKKELYDSALPSGNSTMSGNLIRLGILNGNNALRSRGENMLDTMRSAMTKYPSSFARWARYDLYRTKGMREVAIVGDRWKAFAQHLLKDYYPAVWWMATNKEEADFPLLAGRKPVADTKIYICKDYACGLPVSELKEAEQQLRQHT